MSIRRLLCLPALVLVLAGCGGDDEESAAPEATAEATVSAADAAQVRSELREAVSYMEVYYVDTMTYTADEKKYGPDFPQSVEVEQADESSFTASASVGDQKFTITKQGGGAIERTCEPADGTGCSGGSW